MAQRAMVVTELMILADIEHGETAVTRCRQSRIKKDNNQLDVIVSQNIAFDLRKVLSSPSRNIHCPFAHS
ncbi:hypothetical protein Pmani_001294 [Petrolisthes manimaculis]|uniref:Uncharacterized protein n=1 Tax=Petrolisthes manimaculis TaxID=1843537 RepID=A0AAE1UPK0_9EUCA|nr:hypothetical protein Pmani_001294 [Petrolisthes manimaculis]